EAKDANLKQFKETEKLYQNEIDELDSEDKKKDEIFRRYISLQQEQIDKVKMTFTILEFFNICYDAILYLAEKSQNPDMVQLLTTNYNSKVEEIREVIPSARMIGEEIPEEDELQESDI
ncbi:MAG: hypothetical protein EZS28_021745, partial [Streblomastix strix]